MMMMMHVIMRKQYQNILADADKIIYIISKYFPYDKYIINEHLYKNHGFDPS